MTTTPEPLTDIQQATLASGERLAKEVGLVPYPFNETPEHDIDFMEGQIAMVVTPDDITVGKIKVEIQHYPKNCYVIYTMKDVLSFRKDAYRDDEDAWEWSPSATDLRLPSGATLYVTPVPQQLIRESKDFWLAPPR